MDNKLHDKLGVLEAMRLLQELHREGYQKLRWFSYMSPNGCCLRCHITTEDNIRYYSSFVDIIDINDENSWWISFSEASSGIDVKTIIDEFKKELSKFIEKGKGEDEEYVRWFEKLVEKAQDGCFPEYQAEFVKFPPYTVMVKGEFLKMPIPQELEDLTNDKESQIEESNPVIPTYEEERYQSFGEKKRRNSKKDGD